MRTVSIRLEDLAKMTVKIGFVGENEHTRVCIDCKKAFEEYPNAAAALTVQPPAGEAYPDVTTRDGDTVIWDVMDHDLTDEGEGEFQLSFVVDETVMKSYIGRLAVCRSIVPAGDVPAAIDDWLTRANAALAEIPVEIAAALEEAKESGEFDGADGFSPVVEVSEITGGHQVSVTDAQGTDTFNVMDGEKGDQGVPGQDGITPNVQAGTTTTGDAGTNASVTRRAGSPDSAPVFDFAIPKGDKGDKGDQGDPAPADQVQPAVNAYLAQVITNPDSPPLDRTLSSSSAATPADITGNLKSALESFSYVENKNAVPWTQGWIRTDGTDGDDSAACRTNGYLRLQSEVTVTPKNSYKCNLFEYSSESISSFVRKVEDSFFTDAKTISVDPSHYYRFVVRKVDGSNITYNTLPADTVVYTERHYTDESLLLEGVPADAKATGDKIEQVKEDTMNISSQFDFINLFNKETITEDKYLNTANGQPADLSDYFCSDYIDVSNYESVVLIGTHIVCLYNENKVFTGTPESMDSRYNDITLTIPTGCKYIRFSTQDSYLNAAQIGENVSRTSYVPYGYFKMPHLLKGEAVITVKPSGGDYSSFTQAVKDNLNTGIKIIVYPGEYDIVAEYKAIWGETAVNGMADSSTVFDGFQYGVILKNREIEFMPGAKIVCDWTGHTVDGSHRFSPIRVDYNVIIKGMNLNCRNTFYAIHDDYGLTNTPFTNEYHDCVVNAENLVQQNVIGGGCKRYSRHIIDNCYFNNGTNSNIHTVRYHNTNQANAVPEIYVSNTFFNGTFTARWYGTQETKMTVYVNNCKARAIYTMQEAEGYTTENVDLFKWNNEETNPV